MTTEERREYERKRWHKRYADPEFRKREAERSKKRMAEYLADDMNRERYNAKRREWYRKNREKILEYKRNWGKQRKSQEEMG